MTISQAARHLGVSRRTVERYRDGYTDATGYHAPKMTASMWIKLPSGQWRVDDAGLHAWKERRQPKAVQVVASNSLARRLRSHGFHVVGPTEQHSPTREGRCAPNTRMEKVGIMPVKAAASPDGSRQGDQGNQRSLGALVPSNT